MAYATWRQISLARHQEDRESEYILGFDSIAWKSGLVSADRWRGGLVRLAAQKRERKQQRHQTVVEGAVETSGVDVPEGDH